MKRLIAHVCFGPGARRHRLLRIHHSTTENFFHFIPKSNLHFSVGWCFAKLVAKHKCTIVYPLNMHRAQCTHTHTITPNSKLKLRTASFTLATLIYAAASQMNIESSIQRSKLDFSHSQKFLLRCSHACSHLIGLRVRFWFSCISVGSK